MTKSELKELLKEMVREGDIEVGIYAEEISREEVQLTVSISIDGEYIETGKDSIYFSE